MGEAFYKIFDSDDPEKPTFEDEFKMDLAATLNYKSVAEMIDTLDEFEYQFWYQKYRRCIFGPTMENHQLAQIAYVTANAFSKSKIKFEDFVYKVIKSLQEQMNDATEKMYFQDVYHSLVQKGFDQDEAKELAIHKTEIYMNNIKKRQFEESQN